MRNTRVLVSLVLVPAIFIIALMTAWSTGFAQDPGKEKGARPLVKWEYKVVPAARADRFRFDSNKTEETLNKLGNEGWECVGTITDFDSGAGARTAGTSMGAYLILKRPKQ